MTSSRRPPSFIPATPLSQPAMTWPWPSGKVNGWPRFHEASNSLPVDHESPTYWTVTVSPAFAAGPLPTTRSFLIRSGGGSPCGAASFGFCLRFFAFATVGASPGFEAGVVSVAAGAAAVSVWAGALLSLFLSSSDPPHPAAASASAASRGANERSDGMGGDPRDHRSSQCPQWATRRPWMSCGGGPANG